MYLAGPIAGLTYDEGQDWREYVQGKMDPQIRSISPLRCKRERLVRTGTITDSYEDFALTTQKGITTRDRFDCTRADLVFINLLGAKSVSIGTCIEFGWADAARNPIVMVIEKKSNLHDHPMIRDIAGFRVESLDEGILIAEAILLPEGKHWPDPEAAQNVLQWSYQNASQHGGPQVA